MENTQGTQEIPLIPLSHLTVRERGPGEHQDPRRGESWFARFVCFAGSSSLISRTPPIVSRGAKNHHGHAYEREEVDEAGSEPGFTTPSSLPC